MTDSELKLIISRGYEQRGIEFKGPGTRTDVQHFGVITRAMLGMSNKRDGGLIIIGVSEGQNHELQPVGLNSSDLVTWTYDDIAAKANEYADPPLAFELEIVTATYNQQQLSFVVIQVNEFQEIPTLCKKELDNPTNPSKKILRRGACYVRSMAKPETSEIPSQTDMRELLDVATEKAVRKFAKLKTIFDSAPSSTTTIPLTSADDQFRKQIEGIK